MRLERHVGGPTTQKTAVSDVGDAGLYFDDPGNWSALEARSGSYLVEVFVQFFTPDVTEARLQPLVATAISRLQYASLAAR